MRIFLFALLLLLTSVANTAWTQPYKKQYSFSNATSINNFSSPYSLIQTLDGGFAFTITSRSSWLTQNGFTLTKTTDDGTVEWAIEYDTLMYDDYPMAFLQLSDSSYYVITAANQYARFHTWRIGPGGALLQARTYLPLTPPNAFFPEAMCLDQGEQPVFAVNKSSQSSLMKTDLTGNVLWAKKYLPANISATSSKITLVKTASDGGFLAGGNVYVDDTSILNADSSFLQVFKTDSTGQPLWSLHILLNITSSTSIIRVNSITETSTGDLLFAGSTDGTIQKGFILKTSSSGSYKWLKVFNNTNRIGSIYELPNGNYRFTALQYDPLVTNLDSAGNTLQCYFLDVNSPVSKYAVSVIPTNNQGLALLCASNFSLKHLIITDSNLQSGCYQQQTIFPTTSSFNYLINTNTITATSDFIIGFDITSFCTTYPAVVTVTPDCPTGLFHSPSEGNISFSPNPFTDHITLSSGLPDGRFLMRINDAAGRLVFQQWVNGNGTGLIEANLSFLTNGVYALTLIGEQSSGTVRILKM